MNALMGVAKPGDMGVDVMQFNLHKTFSTPHGGGGPGAGPVAVRDVLAPYLPVPRVVRRRRAASRGATTSRRASAACARSTATSACWCAPRLHPARSAGRGSSEATRLAILNANYLRARLRGRLPPAVRRRRRCTSACSPTARSQPHGVQTLDVAKRLLDYGFYPPTIYFPLVVTGALMIEPTETESKETLDEFVDAMLAIAEEARDGPERGPRRRRTARGSAASTRRARRGGRCCAGGPAAQACGEASKIDTGRVRR